MARRYLNIGPSTFERLLKEGRGRGSGASYKPWREIHEYSSRGRKQITSCALTGFRAHHLFTDLEWYAFLDAWWDCTVTDIREQVPLLPLADTLGIATLLKIEHPFNRKVKFPIPQVLDLLITTTSGLKAWSVMTDSTWEAPRVQEKHELAKRYWADRNIPLERILGSALPKQRAENLDWIYAQRREKGAKPYVPGQHATYDAILDVVTRHGICLAAEVARHIESRRSMRRGEGMEAIRYLLAERWLVTDVNTGVLKQQCLIATPTNPL
ncbi:Transposon Tn7 transposition protein TnsA [Cupriavidus yeoncheonensis]|uniref:Transposon Tn7 transposition protein TnsA n=1 Tax=Cupriavidus yeoncheonensis TaxID=1462994 RepID=A0A916N802_9BURK|nr:TnsA endonuclease N-terminal domain-containing protein [Cupriavidus yeoncheonensis]CAG2158329.1 Transposon Tn7 transposition protein TnsA [Cupriavidus yeoncheonensis]